MEPDKGSLKFIEFLQAQAELPSFLNKEAVFNLASCSTEVYKQIIPHISQNYYFTYNELHLSQNASSQHWLEYCKKPQKTNLVLLFTPQEPRWVGVLTSSITHLKTWGLTEIYPNFPTSSITHLELGECFNNNVDNLPKTLTHLIVGDNFDQSVDTLPESLTHLSFGAIFNQNVDFLPPRLTHLKFGASFDKEVDHLPVFLTHLKFGCLRRIPFPPKGLFNHEIGNLPKYLHSLTIFGIFDKTTNNLPRHLQILQLTSQNFSYSYINLPPITNLIIFVNYSFLTPKNPTLDFGSSSLFNIKKLKIIDFMERSYNICNLPPNMTHLHLTSYQNDLNEFPPTLTHLTIGTSFNNVLLCLPMSLTHLRLPWSFNHPLDLPDFVTHLHLGASYSHVRKLSLNLPSCLTHVTFQGHVRNLTQIPEHVLKNAVILMDTKPQTYVHCKLTSHDGRQKKWYYYLSVPIPEDFFGDFFETCVNG